MNAPVFGAYTKDNDREGYVSLVGVRVTVKMPTTKMTGFQENNHG
jgi:hypothetical protein